MATAGDFALAWPTWTSETAGTTVVDVLLGWSVDTAFDQLWGDGTNFGAHVREARSIKDYVEGPWVRDSELWESVSSGAQSEPASAPKSFSNKAEYSGRSRKVTFSQAASGGLMKSTYINEEVQRCIHAEAGKAYRVQCTVGTNAPYGERFRILLRYTLDATRIEDKPACSLRVEYSLEYVKSTSGMLKSVIGSGVDGGVRKNFGVLRELMAELVEIRDNQPEAPEAAPTPEATGVEAAARLSEAGQRVLAGALGQLAAAERRLLVAAEPAAAWLRVRLAGSRLAESLPLPVSSHVGVVAVTVAVMAVILAVLLWLKALADAPLAEYCATDGCIPGVGQFVCFLYSASHVVDLPDSLREVAGCVVLLTVVQHLGAMLLAHLPLEGKQPGPVQQAVATGPAAGAEGCTQEVADDAEDVGSAAEFAPPLAEEGGSKVAAPAPVMGQEVQRQLTNLKSGFKEFSSTIVKSTQDMVNDVATSMQRTTAPAPARSAASSSHPSKPIPSPQASDPGPAPEAHQIPDAAELFENERYQPLRGWGHSWPGHLMPGDCSHWSARDGAASSMVCAEALPKLPAGYQWRDAAWGIDMEGADSEGVDEDGWTYGVHWKWITHPPTAGTGKKKFGYHFVRRRRWVRRWRTVENGEEAEDDRALPDITARPEVGKQAKAPASQASSPAGTRAPGAETERPSSTDSTVQRPPEDATLAAAREPPGAALPEAPPSQSINHGTEYCGPAAVGATASISTPSVAEEAAQPAPGAPASVTEPAKGQIDQHHRADSLPDMLEEEAMADMQLEERLVGPYAGQKASSGEGPSASAVFAALPGSDSASRGSPEQLNDGLVPESGDADPQPEVSIPGKERVESPTGCAPVAREVSAGGPATSPGEIPDSSITPSVIPLLSPGTQEGPGEVSTDEPKKLPASHDGLSPPPVRATPAVAPGSPPAATQGPAAKVSAAEECTKEKFVPDSLIGTDTENTARADARPSVGGVTLASAPGSAPQHDTIPAPPEAGNSDFVDGTAEFLCDLPGAPEPTDAGETLTHTLCDTCSPLQPLGEAAPATRRPEEGCLAVAGGPVSPANTTPPPEEALAVHAATKEDAEETALASATSVAELSAGLLSDNPMFDTSDSESPVRTHMRSASAALTEDATMESQARQPAQANLSTAFAAAASDTGATDRDGGPYAETAIGQELQPPAAQPDAEKAAAEATDSSGIDMLMGGSTSRGTPIKLEDAGANFMRLVGSNTGNLAQKMSGAVGKMGNVFEKTGAALEKTTSDVVQAVRSTDKGTRTGAAPARRPSSSFDRSVSESDKPGDNRPPGAEVPGPASPEAVWHKKAVKDMRRLAGEVNIDTVNGAAQRVGAEMNVAAKKLTGEMNDAARKLTGLFGGRPPTAAAARTPAGKTEPAAWKPGAAARAEAVARSREPAVRSGEGRAPRAKDD